MITVEKVHLFATVFMVGVIWVVQIVQYPSFSLVSAEQFAEYHKKHSDRISYIVAPVMLIELTCAYWLFYELGGHYSYYFFISLLIFAFTAFVSVPLHNKLSVVKNQNTISKLVRTNWVRTVLWSFKLLLLYYYL